jgi:hypothetical protein
MCNRYGYGTPCTDTVWTAGRLFLHFTGSCFRSGPVSEWTKRCLPDDTRFRGACTLYTFKPRHIQFVVDRQLLLQVHCGTTGVNLRLGVHRFGLRVCICDCDSFVLVSGTLKILRNGA